MHQGLFKTTKKPSKNIIFGSGIKVHQRNVALDTNKAIIPKETYSQFGRYIINNHRLNDDVIMLRSKKGAAIPYIPTQKVSKNLIKCEGWWERKHGGQGAMGEEA